MSEQQQFTLGQAAVGMHLDGPTQQPDVEELKRVYAMAIDIIAGIVNQSEDPEVRRLGTVAITETQGAQMWAVKAITWRS